MIRTLGAAALLLALVGPAAQAADKEPGVNVAYKAEQLGSDQGLERLRQQAAQKIDAFCRSNPIEGTVANCRAYMTAKADQQIQVRAVEYAQARGQIQLSGRQGADQARR